jgi:hypothetical protein
MQSLAVSGENDDQRTFRTTPASGSPAGATMILVKSEAARERALEVLSGNFTP